MKTKLALFAAALALAATPMVQATPTINDLTNGLNAFVDNTPGALPFAAGAGMDWSNAYIGQLVDGDFPFVHLGLGGTVGFTTLPEKAVSPLITALGGSLPEGMNQVPLPFAVVNARVGGLILPFDVGLKVGFLPPALGNAVPGYSFKYQNFGADFRYNLVKSDFLLPDISVGGGINVLKAAVTADLGGSSATQYYDDGSHTLTVGAPILTMDLNAVDIEVKGQISKTFFFLLTPYVGGAFSFGSARARASIDATVSDSLGNLGYWNQYGLNPSANGFFKEKGVAPVALKVYGGASINVLILKVDGQVLVNTTDGAIGASVMGRLQL